ncbi:hypothetical protein IFR05_006086 [Cadophora sp. M221]|nr:hypothetical protein IFR05_006086 [Cadophora sp. M221]
MAARIALLSLMAGSVLSLVHTQRLSVYRRELDDQSLTYLTSMCLPNYMEAFNNIDVSFEEMLPSLHNSTLPCEQEGYIYYTCMANGTTEIDFLAEQQCICGSNFLSANKGCNACYRAHGSPEGVEVPESSVSSVWTAACSASPTQPFGAYFTTANDQQFSPTSTLGPDKFPNNTAVSNYWTGLPSASLGSITGSATARATEWADEEETTSTSTSTSTSRRANFSFTSTVAASHSTSSATESSSPIDSSGSMTSAPTFTTPISPLSQASTTASTSTNGGGMEMGVAWNSGVVLVVVNVVVIAFL